MMIETSIKWKTVLSFLLIVGCGSGAGPSQGSQGMKLSAPEAKKKIMKVTSSAFKHGDPIKPEYTVEGKDISPPLAWSQVPEGTKSFALICDDPDAPSPRRPAAEPWVHWVIYNISADCTELPPGIARTLEPETVRGARQGRNSWPNDNIGYRGPAPPPGSGPHRYFFKLYALDTLLDLRAGATKKELLQAMDGHILAEGQLFGLYQR